MCLPKYSCRVSGKTYEGIGQSETDYSESGLEIRVGGAGSQKELLRNTTLRSEQLSGYEVFQRIACWYPLSAARAQPHKSGDDGENLGHFFRALLGVFYNDYACTEIICVERLDHILVFVYFIGRYMDKFIYPQTVLDAVYGPVYQILVKFWCLCSTGYVAYGVSKVYSFLYRESSENDRVNELRDELDLFCKENNVKCVVSSLFTSLSQRGVLIEQTDILSPLCLKIAPNDRVFFADDYFCEYVCAIVGQQIDPEYLNLTAIEYLAKQDAREGSEYLRTLNCYLDCRNNASLAAKKLFIDRTTLKYRLKKIDQLMHVNIESPATAIALKYGILIRDILLANSNAAESGGSRSNSGRVRQTPVFWEAGATK